MFTYEATALSKVRRKPTYHIDSILRISVKMVLRPEWVRGISATMERPKHVAAVETIDKEVCQFVENWFGRSGFKWDGDDQAISEHGRSTNVLECKTLFGKVRVLGYDYHCHCRRTRERNTEPLSEAGYLSLMALKMEVKMLLNYANKMVTDSSVPLVP